MNPDTQKRRKILRGALSVVLATGGAIVTFFTLLFLFMACGFWGWSDGGDPDFLRRLERTTNITTIISIVAAIIAFIVIVLKINKKQLKR